MGVVDVGMDAWLDVGVVDVGVDAWLGVGVADIGVDAWLGVGVADVGVDAWLGAGVVLGAGVGVEVGVEVLSIESVGPLSSSEPEGTLVYSELVAPSRGVPAGSLSEGVAKVGAGVDGDAEEGGGGVRALGVSPVERGPGLITGRERKS